MVLRLCECFAIYLFKLSYKNTDISKYTPGGLINTQNQKYVDSPRLKNRAELHNLQDVAKAYAEAGSLTELSQKIESKKPL